MSGDDEFRQIQQVIERLVIRYPLVPPDDIERAVHGVHLRFATSRVRDFVPLLVERAVKRELTGHPMLDSTLPPAVPDLGR
ncbi:three-helix bundle dimerization domain-containing protein [Rhodococcus pyridinivorans]|uniref:three-helix bundle dimerization domain-containing protein n=1 Tax=Rhodococcus pyridinivorans TaxID=103816 RepID=UPI00349EFCD3